MTLFLLCFPLCYFSPFFFLSPSYEYSSRNPDPGSQSKLFSLLPTTLASNCRARPPSYHDRPDPSAPLCTMPSRGRARRVFTDQAETLLVSSVKRR